MSFGYSVGDFFAVGRLVYDIIEALRESEPEYQELVRELERYEFDKTLSFSVLSHTKNGSLIVIQPVSSP